MAKIYVMEDFILGHFLGCLRNTFKSELLWSRCAVQDCVAMFYVRFCILYLINIWLWIEKNIFLCPDIPRTLYYYCLHVQWKNIILDFIYNRHFFHFRLPAIWNDQKLLNRPPVWTSSLPSLVHFLLSE